MGENANAIAAGMKALCSISHAKLDFPRGCKYRSGQLSNESGRVWEVDQDDPNRAFKVWHCRKLDKRVIWRDCKDNDAEQHCAEVEDGS